MTELSDKEIVAACARAMEMEFFIHDSITGVWRNGMRAHYNPLTDCAQAMELVEKLEMFIARTNTGFWEVYALCSGGKVFSENLLRAICLCAARVQIEKEKNA